MKGGKDVRRMAWGFLMMLAVGVSTVAPLSAQAPSQVSPDEFASLEWLEGRWAGSGGGVDAFYESYRFVNDSTIEQTTWRDATFSVPESRARLELRNGWVLKSRDGEVESFVSDFDGESVDFSWADRSRPGFNWTRLSGDQWRAVLDRSGGQPPIVYTLQRMAGGN